MTADSLLYCFLQGGKLAAQYDAGSKDQRNLDHSKPEWEKPL